MSSVSSYASNCGAATQPQAVREAAATTEPAPDAVTGGGPTPSAEAGTVSAGGPASELGSTNAYPWSGYWWPQRASEDDLNLYDAGSALAKYDEYVLNTRGYDPQSREWERQNHSNDASWAGHCQAWAAASLLTKEPPKSITRGGVDFDHDSLEGLVTAVYYEPTFEWLAGNRAESSSGPDFTDMNPADVDSLVRQRLGVDHTGFIMDIDAGAEVWNFPAFAYRRNATTDPDGTEHVNLIVYFTNASADTVGEPDWFARTYTYDLKADIAGRVNGTWTGDSVESHPDFAWMPTGKTSGSGMDPRNPRIDESIVEEILGYQI